MLDAGMMLTLLKHSAGLVRLPESSMWGWGGEKSSREAAGIAHRGEEQLINNMDE